jgi:23S rRNA (guanosine2251-2'-O)-methyltransferase
MLNYECQTKPWLPHLVPLQLFNPSTLQPIPYLCRMRKLEMQELNRKTVTEFKAAEKIPIIILLDNVRSMHNVGSIFRTADAFLLEAIYLCGFTPRPPHRDIQKTALGATETVSWKYFADGLTAANDLIQQGFELFAIEQVENSRPLYYASMDMDKKMAVVFGNELTGVSEELLKRCKGCLEIPQWGMKHSLNVSVAAGIVIWELARNRLIAQNNPAQIS